MHWHIGSTWGQHESLAGVDVSDIITRVCDSVLHSLPGDGDVKQRSKTTST